MTKSTVDIILLAFANISIPSKFKMNKATIPTIAIVFTVTLGIRLLIYSPNANANELLLIGVTNFEYATKPPALTPERFVTIE